mmetsp:Transcript_79138/g.157324  ORF Transcript_79138/g.157324 Transcript_79138/m.157324 type:complete len:288 (+) Transcript_79138:302-1165(+)
MWPIRWPSQPTDGGTAYRCPSPKVGSLKVGGVVLLGVLPCEFEEHRVVEELRDRDILREALAAACLHHELAGEVRRRLGLEGAKRDVLVQRVARHDGEVVKRRKTKGLALRVRAQVGLEAERIDDRHVGRDEVEWSAWPRPVGGDMAPPTTKHSVDGGDAVNGGDDLHEIDRLHQPRRCHEEGGVGDAARGGDDLATSAMYRLWGDRCVEHLKLHIPHWLVAQRPLARRPAKALEDVVADRVEKRFVHLGWQGIIHEDVGATLVWSEAPDGARGEQIPIVPLLKKFA